MSPRPKAGSDEAASAQSVRDRILNTARELFYKEGARAVGVDTVVAQSGVAKTSLYRWFPSKDALIVAVLEQESKDRWEGWERIAQRSDPEPRARLRAHLTGVVKYVNGSHFRGCPFMNVTAEFADPQHPARVLALGEMAELRRRLRGLVDNIEGVRDPAELTEQLLLLVDGAFSSAQGLGRDGPQKFLVAAADALVDAQLKK
jgi:AcrR family transcriptional regulator